MKKIIVLLTVLSMITVGLSVSATTPMFNENQPSQATIENVVPEVKCGWIEILDQQGCKVYDSRDCGPDYEFPRRDPYIWESEKIVVWAIICDKNGRSDLHQHTVEAKFSQPDVLIDMTPMGLDHFLPDDPDTEIDENELCGVFKGEYLIPAFEVLHCGHDIAIECTDKFGGTAVPFPYHLTNCAGDMLIVYINPEMSSTFDPTTVIWQQFVTGVGWIGYPACTDEVPANDNPYVEHCYAKCYDPYLDEDVEVRVKYLLKIHGTDLEALGNNAGIIDCENILWAHYYPDPPDPCDIADAVELLNGEVDVGEFETCEDIFFCFWLNIPCGVEPGDFHGQIGLAIEVL
jgi:hypothetical protein